MLNVYQNFVVSCDILLDKLDAELLKNKNKSHQIFTNFIRHLS